MSSSVRPVASICTLLEILGQHRHLDVLGRGGQRLAVLGQHQRGARRWSVSSLALGHHAATPCSVEVITSRSKVLKSVSALVPSVVVQAPERPREAREASTVRITAEEGPPPGQVNYAMQLPFSPARSALYRMNGPKARFWQQCVHAGIGRPGPADSQSDRGSAATLRAVITASARLKM